MYSHSATLILTRRIFSRYNNPCPYKHRFRTISICNDHGSSSFRFSNGSRVKITSRYFSSSTSLIKFAKSNRNNDIATDELPKAKIPKKPTKSIVLNNPDQWKLIYRFKHIVAARAIQRLKLYQTGLTCFGILPISIASTVMDQSQMIFTYYALGGSLLACAMLYIMGTFSSRIIGAIYINKEDPRQINLARLTFFGSRNDTQIHTESFIHLNDMNLNPRDVYIKLQTVDGLEKDLGPLYLSLRYGDISDLKSFERIFGTMDEFQGIERNKK